MFQDKIKDLKKKIDEKEKILKEKKLVIDEINNKENNIKKYEDAKSDIKFYIKAFIFLAIIGMTMGLLTGLPIIKKAFFSLAMVGLWELLGGLVLKEDYLDRKKTINEITQNKYEKLKEDEEKNKELKLSLEEEYTLIKQEKIDLEEILAWVLKAEDMRKFGYKVELITDEKLLYQNEEEQQKKQCIINYGMNI